MGVDFSRTRFGTEHGEQQARNVLRDIQQWPEEVQAAFVSSMFQEFFKARTEEYVEVVFDNV